MHRITFFRVKHFNKSSGPFSGLEYIAYPFSKGI